MTRRESREAAMGLIFEQDFDITRDPEEILSLAAEERGERFSTFARELFIRTSEFILQREIYVPALVGFQIGYFALDRNPAQKRGIADIIADICV